MVQDSSLADLSPSEVEEVKRELRFRERAILGFIIVQALAFAYQLSVNGFRVQIGNYTAVFAGVWAACCGISVVATFLLLSGHRVMRQLVAAPVQRVLHTNVALWVKIVLLWMYSFLVLFFLGVILVKAWT